jgi:transposase
MAGITVTTGNGVRQIFRTFSSRDENNKPQRTRKLLGKIDETTNKPIFNKFFTALIDSQGITLDQIYSLSLHDIPKIVNFGTKDEPVDKVIDNEQFSLKLKPIKNIANVVINDEVLQENNINIEITDNTIFTFPEQNIRHIHFGPHIILIKLIESIGLLDILRVSFPSQWKEILTIAYFLVNSNKPLMYCDKWAQHTTTYLDYQSVESQRISDLLKVLSIDDINRFYERWTNINIEDGYVALDITSISSYSKFISLIEPGYNRNGEKLPQLNLSMLFGEQSKLPIFSKYYSGSINDVSTLKNCISHLDSIKAKSLKLVMDKGFFSQSNIFYLLKKRPDYKFLISVPFTNSLAKNIVTEGTANFNFGAPFYVGKDVIYGYTCRKPTLYSDSLVYHVFYNLKLRNDVLISKIEESTTKLEQFNLNPEENYKKDGFKKDLIIEKDNKNNITASR